MVLEDVIQLVQFELGNRKGLDSIVKAQLSRAKATLEGDDFLPWFLLSEVNSTQTVSSESRVEVPQGMLREYEEGALRIVLPDGSSRILVKGIEQDLEREYPNTGCPQKYALTNKYFRLFPAPDQEYRIELLFYKAAPVFREGEGSPWFQFGLDWLVHMTAFYIADAQRAEDAAKFAQLAGLARQKLIVSHSARAAANLEINMGGY